MPFQGTRDASDIMVKHVPQEPSSPGTKTSGKPSHHQSEITMEPEPDHIQEVSFVDLVAPSNSTYFGFTFPSPFCYNKIIQYISNT